MQYTTPILEIYNEEIFRGDLRNITHYEHPVQEMRKAYAIHGGLNSLRIDIRDLRTAFNLLRIVAFEILDDRALHRLYVVRVGLLPSIGY